MSVVPLREQHAAVVAVDKVTSQRIYHHEDDLVEGGGCSCPSILACLAYSVRSSFFFEMRQTRQNRLIREEAARKS